MTAKWLTGCIINKLANYLFTAAPTVARMAVQGNVPGARVRFTALKTVKPFTGPYISKYVTHWLYVSNRRIESSLFLQGKAF